MSDALPERVWVQANTASRTAKGRPVGYVIREDGCWQWTGGVSGGRYGCAHKDGKSIQAHRFVYEQERGPIPDGLTLDHLCRNTLCVNPDHMEPVPIKVNILRGNGTAARNARRTHCPKGHELSGDNLTPSEARRGRRVCLTCRRALDLARYHRRKGKRQ